MPRVLSFLAVLGFLSSPGLIREQEFPPKQDRCQGKPPDSSCWIELSNQPGCYVWNSHFIPDEARTWTGGCDGAFAEGPGTLIEFSGTGRKILESFGHFKQGKRHGHWGGIDARGNFHEGPFVDGKMHGRWVLRDKDGNQEMVTFKNGERVG